MAQDPNLILGEVLQRQQRLERKAEQVRLMHEGRAPEPGVADHLRVRLGDALVELGERLRAETGQPGPAPALIPAEALETLARDALLHGGEGARYSSGWYYAVSYGAPDAASPQEERWYLLCWRSITPSRQSSWQREESR